MDAEPAGVPIEELLAHARFVRGLTRSLVSDAHLAEDLEQETWTAALENPPRAGVRAWFRAVARNLAANTFRSKERRGRRERGAARPEAEPPTVDLVARDAILREVLEAVLALDPPHREVVHLRFYEGLPPREIAARLGVPVNTVRSRLGRAIADLRERLDRRHGGRRDAWILGIAAMAGSEHGVPWGWIVGMKAKVAAAAALLLLLGGGAWILRDRGEAPPPAAIETATAPLAVPRPAEAPATGTEIPTHPVASPAAPSAEKTPPESPTSGSYEAFLEGVVVDGDGRPVAGARVILDAPGAASNQGVRRSTPADAEGRFRFTLQARSGTVFADVPGCAPSEPVTLDEIPGATRTVRLVIPGAEGSLEGLVLDSAGNPVPKATVRVGPPDELLAPALRAAGRTSPVVETDDLGRFRVAGLSAGKTEVMARSASLPPRMFPIAIEAGKTTRAELRLFAGSVLVGTVRDGEGKPVPKARVFVDRFTGAPMGATADPEGRFRIEGAFSGSVEVHVEEGKRGKASMTVEAPAGEETRCDLVLSIDEIIRGRVLDPEGKPLAGWTVTARPGRWFFAGQGSVLESPTDAGGGFLLQNLAAGAFDLLVRPERYGVPSLVVSGVKAGGEAVEIRVPASALPTAGIRGVLKDGEGKPLQQAWLSLFPEIARLSSVASARPDPATGVFAKDHLPPGRYRINMGSKTAGIRNDLGVVELLPGKVLDMGDVVLSPPGRVLLVLPEAGERPPADQVQFTVEEAMEDGSWFPAGEHALGPGYSAPEILLGPGRYRLRVTGNFVAVHEARFAVRSGQETPVEIPLRKAPQRFLLVRGSDLAKEATFVHSRITDREGTLHQEVNFGRGRGQVDILGYAFLPAGTYELEVTPEGGESKRLTLSFGATDGTDPKAPVVLELR